MDGGVTAMNEFEKWLVVFKESPQYKSDSFIWSDMAKEAYKAGMLSASDIAREVDGRGGMGTASAVIKAKAESL
jgi:hypothetical protein